MVSRAFTSVSINCELTRKYHCIKYNKPVKQSWGFRFPYCFKLGLLWLSSEPREVFVVCLCFSREGSKLFRLLQFQITSDVLQRREWFKSPQVEKAEQRPHTFGRNVPLQKSMPACCSFGHPLKNINFLWRKRSGYTMPDTKPCKHEPTMWILLTTLSPSNSSPA